MQEILTLYTLIRQAFGDLSSTAFRGVSIGLMPHWHIKHHWGGGEDRKNVYFNLNML